MDIRRFFSPTNSTKKGATETFTNLTSKEHARLKEKAQPNSKKRRLVIIDSDSDEEPIPTKKTNKLINDASDTKEVTKKKSPVKNCSPTKNKLNFGALKKHKPEANSLKPVLADDFFLSSPKKVATLKVEEIKDEEYEIEDDDDYFEQTLKQLDKKSKNNSNKSNERAFVNGDNGVSKLVMKLKKKEFLKSPDKKDPGKVKVDNEKSINKANDHASGSPVEKSSLEAVSKSYKSSKTAEKSTNAPKNVKSEKESYTVNCSKDKSSPPHVKLSSPMSSAKPVKSTKENDKEDSLPDKPHLDVSSPKPDSTPEAKRNSFNYRNYLHREGPQALGSKEIPDGQEGCLQGLTFIITGILESLERDEAKDLVIKYGGKVMANISKTTQYMVVGRDAGPAKLEKAEKFGTKLINEDELLDLIRTLPGKNPSPKTSKVLNESKSKLTLKKIKEEVVPSRDFLTPAVDLVSSSVKEDVSNLMWVDKYKPTTLKQVIGQQGHSSCAKKLLDWLTNWWKNNSSDKKVQGKWIAKEDGSIFKAALLSGPPGVGKTTTAQLACKELRFQYIELNASDTRSKKSLQTEISELLQNKTLSTTAKKDQLVQRHVIIFDEVDGMSGNEDRGGTQELIALIRQSKIPVICICNDRQHPKIRSLANYCFDLRFLRPRVEQIKGAMLSLLHKEKIKLPTETLHEIITATNQDLRQVLNHLSFLSSKDVQECKNLKPSLKDVRLGPFEVLKRVFAPEEEKASVNDKASLFFHDYSLAPLFVQENYPSVKPVAAKANIHKHLDLLSKAAESVSYSDTIDRCIRSQNSWSLLPTQAIFASVIPGECMRGYMSQMILFPSWLGKNSSKNHMDRVLQQIHMHARLRVSCNKTELALDYLQQMKHNLTAPLIRFGSEMVPKVMEVMENYYLLREDLDSIVELTQWPGQKDPMLSIEPKTKAALTRTLNKEGHKNPYAVVNIKKGKKRSVDTSFDGEEEDAIAESEDDDDSKPDAMVKLKKAPAGKQSKKDLESDGPSSKGKGRGKSSSGRGRGRGKK